MAHIKKEKYTGVFLITITIFLTFLAFLSTPFQFDDKKALFFYTSFHDLSKTKETVLIDEIFLHPLFYFSLTIDWKLWGNKPFWFYQTNIILHVAVALVCFDVLKRLLNNSWIFPAFGSAYFALHPLVIDNITSIVGRYYILSALLWISAFDFYIKAREQNKTKIYYLISIFLFVLSAPGNGTAIILPALLLVFEWLIGKEKSRFLLTVPFFVAVTGIIAGWHFLSNNPNFHIKNYFGNFWLPLFMIAKYLYLVLFPANLTVDTFPLSFRNTGILLPSTFLILVILTSAFYVLGKSKTTFGIFWFFLALVPSLLLPLKEPMLKKSIYFALIGFGFFSASIFQFFFNKKKKSGKILATTMLVCLAFGTISRRFSWSSEEKLWRDAIRKSPDNAVGYNHLGAIMMEKGDLNEAWRLTEAALRREPYSAQAHYNKGLISSQKGDWELASHEFALAHTYNPEMTDAFIAQAEVEIKLHREDNAIPLLETVIRREPNSVKALLLLGKAAKRQEQLDEAQKLFEKVLSLEPNNYDALLGMGLLEIQRNNIAESKKWLEQAVEIDPSRAEANEALIRLSVISGDWNEAVTRLLKAINASPDDPELYRELGTIYMKMKNWEEARKAFTKQMQLKPGDAEPLLLLARLEESRGNSRAAIQFYNRALMLDKKGRYKATVEQILRKLKEEKKNIQ